MNNFKPGSGDLDFGENDSTEETRTEEDTESETPSRSTSSEATPSTQQSPSQTESSEQANPPKYPYFVRRNNVGDERDNRLEIHVRDKVTDQEAEFRTELAEHLGVGEIPKTDAREFALLTAYNNPEQVAERMREEGFGELD